jgi:hypothetical protein
MSSSVGIAPPERVRSTTVQTSAPVIQPRLTRQRRSDLDAAQQALPTTTDHPGSHADSEREDDEEHKDEDDEEEEDDDEEEGDDDDKSENDQQREDDNQKPVDETDSQHDANDGQINQSSQQNRGNPSSNLSSNRGNPSSNLEVHDANDGQINQLGDNQSSQQNRGNPNSNLSSNRGNPSSNLTTSPSLPGSRGPTPTYERAGKQATASRAAPLKTHARGRSTTPKVDRHAFQINIAGVPERTQGISPLNYDCLFLK